MGGWTVRVASAHPTQLEIDTSHQKVAKIRDFPGGPVVKTLRSQYKGAGVRSLVSELDSCMLQLRSDVAKLKKKKKKVAKKHH